jgi:sugar-phosphatase
MNLPNVPILSDLDGTLIDSKTSVVDAFRWWAELRGLSPAVLDRIPFGRTSTDAAGVLAPHLDPTEEGRLLDDRQASHTENVRPLDGALDLLSTHAQLAIVTSCPLRLAEARLRAARLPRPELLLTPECWKFGKPHPEPYLKGAAMLGVDPSSCIVLEDAPSGIESAVRAGMRVIALVTTHLPAEIHGAAAYIRSLHELPTALRALGIG